MKLKSNKMKRAKIRTDLIEQKLSVPVGNKYYGSDKSIPYRWIGEQFQVKLNDKWQNAESIDFDFI
jgi:hypothetical protein